MTLHTMSVSNFTQQCFEKFREAINSRNEMEHQHHLDSRLADFSLWVDNVGAMAKSGASLDSRFRSRPDDLTLVRNILSMLSDFLDEYVDTTNKCLSIAEALANIDSAIKNLAMIGVAIRRTGKASRSRRANQSFNPDEHRDFKRHLECLVLLRPNKDQPQLESTEISNINELTAESSEKNSILEADLKQLAASKMEKLDASRLNDIQKRLIDANLRRRHNFLLAQKRSQRVKKTPQNKVTGEKHQLEDTSLISSEIAITTSGPAQAKISASWENKDQPIKNKAPPTETGFTIASTAEGTLKFDPARNQKAASTVARSQISIIAANTEFPKPPSSSQNQLVFKCPCCCQSLPSEDFIGSNKWRQHLIEDLCPYTCIAQSCPTPDLLFTTRKAWEAHVDNDHPPQWQCLLCDEEDEAFPSEEDITTHTQTQHKEALSKYELSFLISSAEVRCMGIESCPLCSSCGPRDSPELVDHAVRHAYEFALRALPWPQSVIEDLSKPIGTYSLPEDMPKAERFEKWLDSLLWSAEELSLSSFDQLDHTLQEKDDGTPAEDYFASNDYFQDEGSADSSKCQTAQPRSSIIWSDSSDRDLAKENNWADPTQVRTDLIAAARRGDQDAVRRLIEDGHAFDGDSEIRARALIAAVQGGHIGVIKQLLESGIDINSQDENGWTALFFAVELKDESITKYLIKSAIDVNIMDHDGLTALHMAIQGEADEIIRALFTLAVCQGFTDAHGQTPSSWARKKRHRVAAETLRTLEAKYDQILVRAKKALNIDNRTTVARNMIQGDNWYGFINPLLKPVYFELVGTVQHNHIVDKIAFSHDGKYIATCSIGASARIFDFETKEKVFQQDLRTSGYGEVCFTPDGRFLAIASDKIVQVWDIATNSVYYSVDHDGRGCALDVSNDGCLLAYSENNTNICIWDMKQRVKIQNFRVGLSRIVSIKISPDGCFVAAGGSGRSAYVFNLKAKASKERALDHGVRVDSIAFSSDGKYLVSGGGERLKLWELSTGACISDFGIFEFYQYPRSVSITPDDRWIVAAHGNGFIRFWDRTTKTSHCIIDAHHDDIMSIAFRPQGSYFATASYDKTVRIWSYGPRRQ
ncbi:hypothetical protein V8C42DRAFT_318493 [Trichoderma barbatum]